MSQLVLITHESVPCALHSSQVLRAADDRSDEPGISLWRAPIDDRRPGAGALIVETPVGRRRVRFSDARFGALDARTMVPMPALLADCLDLEHVVGVAAQDDVFWWLVDLTRWEER